MSPKAKEMEALTNIDTESQSGFEPASRKRLFFAYYIDLWVLAPPIHILAAATNIQRYSWPLTVLCFLGLEYMVLKFYVRSLGDYALGIRRTREGALVDSRLRANANWFIIITGFAELWSGSRALTGSFLTSDFYYLFGTRIEGYEAKAVFFFGGLLGIWLAFAIFRGKQFALPVLLVFAAFEAANNWSSQPIMVEVANAYNAKRVAAGRKATPVAWIIQFALWWNVSYLALVTVGGYVYRSRFRFQEQGPQVGLDAA